eukprot:364321_1
MKPVSKTFERKLCNMLLKFCQLLSLIIIYITIVSSVKTRKSEIKDRNGDIEKNNNNKNIEQQYKQKLTLIGYGSEYGPARHLISFSKRYNLDFHLIGVNKPWRGFNDKIKGFYNFIKAIDNKHNNSVILVLDAFDTVPICSEEDLLSKFNSFNSDIVISTGKDCWPDPNAEEFLYNRLTPKERTEYKWFPWFLCPNSGAIMGKHDAMLSMFERVQQLVSIGNGSCHDFEGNAFSKNTQSDQRCYVTYYVELTKYSEYISLIHNNITFKNKIELLTKNININGKNIIDINEITNSKNINNNGLKSKSSFDGSISKNYIHLHYGELNKYYNNIVMKLDYTNSLFLSISGMMFMDFDYFIDTSSVPHNVFFKSKITNGSACILHGNGPGVILWRSFIKQIKNKGNLYVDDYVLRVGVDFFHWIMWWIIMPVERLSHWCSKTFDFDLGFHSTTFSEEVIWRFHVWTFVAVVLFIAFPLLYWYKYKFTKNMKININKKYDKKIGNNICNSKMRKSNSFLKLNKSINSP